MSRLYYLKILSCFPITPFIFKEDQATKRE